MAELKNRAAFHEYFIDTRYEAGMMLLGTEVKSLREGKASFNDSYCLLHKGEAWLKNMHIAEYSHASVNNHEPLRDRKLLLQKREIKKIEAKLKEKGYTLIPLRIFFNEKNLAKIELGLAKGKKLHDKREGIRQKEMEREMKRHLK
ncbi:MAG TPA: SsrA-binding protein SmpB [Chitinophagaceae bacterium]|nr:SsrA-binding protein SmpB [Chitinophagaceae bacterium]